MDITLNTDKKYSIKELFQIIEDNTSYRFFYNADLADLNKTVSILQQNIQVKDLLNFILDETSVSYKLLENDMIIVAPKSVLQQGITVTGTVTDKSMPLPGVNVLIKGTSTGVVTDINGKYSISVPNKDAILVFSFIGYTAQEVVAGDNKVINIILEEDTKELEEVVVIGYGSVKKSTLTGAVARMDGESLGDRSLARVETALQGNLAGVAVRTTSGEPGEDMQIRVRGAASVNASSDPLYVVDGTPISSLAGINPGDISSIEVLKDAASAAIYGSRGSNGVVIVTTKKGVSGKPKISFSASYGIQTLEKKVDVLSAAEWMEFKIKYSDENYLRQARNRGITDASISDPSSVRLTNINANPTLDYTNNITLDDRWFQYVSDATRSAHTYQATNEPLNLLDWQDEFYRTAAVQDYNISLSGGTENTKYLFSGGYFDQEGLATGTGYKRFSARTNIESKITKFLTAGIMLAPTYIKRDGVGLANGKDQQSHNALCAAPVSEGDVGYMVLVEPNVRYRYTAADRPSPVAVMQTNLHQQEILRMLGNAFVRLEPIQDLKIELLGSANYYDFDRMSYNFSTVTTSWTLGEGQSSSAYHMTDRKWNTLLQALVNYNKVIGVHDFGIMLGASTEQSNIGFYTDQRYNKPFPNDAVTGSFDGSKVSAGTNTVTEGTPNRVVSYFGRLQYSYDDRYLFTGSLRYDGGSVFGANRKWGMFPAISGAWKISNEKFFQNLNIEQINLLKLRASYGATGNNSIGTTAGYGTLASSIYAGLAGYTINTIVMDNIGWEKTNSVDIALDFAMLQNRIQFSFDWYNKKTTDLLYQIPVHGASGISTVWGNLGNVQNRGFEIELHTKNLTGAFKWSTSFNFSYNENEVLKLGATDTPVYWAFDNSNVSNKLMVNEPINSFYLFEAIGVWRTQKEIDDYSAAHGGKPVTYEGKKIQPGDIRHKDVNNDGVFDKENDRAILGSPIPKCVYGMTNKFEYKNFDLSILLTAQTGGKIYGLLGRHLSNPGMGADINLMGNMKNAWWSETDQGDGKTPYYFSTTTSGLIDSRWLYSSDYLRIKNLTFGYKIPINPKFISYARVYISIENLYKWDNYYGGYTPESSNTGSSAYGIDYGGYPSSRIFTIGANFNF